MPKPLSLSEAVAWTPLLASAAVGGFFGFLSARFQDYLRRRQHFRTLAGALQVDADRIRRELGTPSNTYVELDAYGSVPSTPTIHRWAEGLIVDAGEIDSEIVRQFLMLERNLHNLAHYLDKLRDTTSHVSRLEEGVRQAETEGAAGAISAVNARREIRRVQPAATHAHDMLVLARKNAVECLDSIDQLLAPYSRPLAKRVSQQFHRAWLRIAKSGRSSAPPVPPAV